MKTLFGLILQNLAFISLALLQIFYFSPAINSIAARIFTQILGVLLLLITGFIDGVYFCIDEDDNEH